MRFRWILTNLRNIYRSLSQPVVLIQLTRSYKLNKSGACACCLLGLVWLDVSVVRIWKDYLLVPIILTSVHEGLRSNEVMRRRDC